MAAEVALGHVGIVLGLEVSRLARNNADWYRLLDLCGMTDTLIGDADGLYHPPFNDRLVLGLKGTMSEAELHVLRARLIGGIRNKAARGELRRGLPVGLVWGEADGEVLLASGRSCQRAPSALSLTASPRSARHAKSGSGSAPQGLSFPLQSNTLDEVRWKTCEAPHRFPLSLTRLADGGWLPDCDVWVSRDLVALQVRPSGADRPSLPRVALRSPENEVLWLDPAEPLRPLPDGSFLMEVWHLDPRRPVEEQVGLPLEGFAWFPR